MFKRISLMLGILLIGSGLKLIGIPTDPVVQALKAKGPVAVLFKKNSCPFCVWLKPIFHQLQTRGSGARFVVVDVSSNPAYYKQRYRFSTVPTVIYYNTNGQEVARHGSNNRTITLSQMQQYLKRTFV